jgi:dihydroorotate dehydrogenase (NAD+) catalytic subunit
VSGTPGERSSAASRAPLAPEEVDVAVDLGPLHLANPILTASGTSGSGRELSRLFDVTRLGAVVVKSLTLEPRAGLPAPRMVETPSGMLNAIGLQNPGIDAWLTEDLPWLQAQGVAAIVSIAGRTVEEFRQVAGRLAGAQGLLAVEANISCPNVEDRGVVFACRTGATEAAIAAVAGEVDLPVLAKLTPDVTDITEIAGAAHAAGAAGVTLINTLLGMAIDVGARRPVLGGRTGGLSGPAIKPVALRAVYQVAAAFPDLPIVGVGGVCSVTDVIEFVLAGASAVGVGTATFADPTTTLDLVEALPRWLAERGCRRLVDLRGAAHR